ncbi:MAG: oxidoreductase [Thermodesulfobacteriota bacterium]
MNSFSELFSPFQIGNLRIANRLVMPPMATNFAEADGSVSPRQIAYYLRRAQGGVGYITFEHTGILPQGKASSNMALIDKDEKIPFFQKLTAAIHQVGGKIVIQINHAGRQTSASITGMPIVAPSPIPCPVRKEKPHPLTKEEIQKIVESFAQAAKRVQAAGADGVEIHMAHGYLLAQFLSPFANQRNDEYGGSLENRMTVPLQVLRAVRQAVGSQFPIICRLSADEYVEGGLKIKESKEIAKNLEKNGADALHISACLAASVYLNHPPYYAEEGIFVPLAQEIKSVVSIPVITVGRIRTPHLANQILKERKADLVSMGRALIADPDLPQKVFQGKTEEITPCISCNRCILTLRRGTLQCAVNPEAGRESSLVLSKTNSPKKVWIIGGGPAGMKAAEIAARRGHQVTLYEAKKELGGQFLLAALPPHKAVLREFITYLQHQLAKLPIKIILEHSFAPSLLETDRPDVAILATGSKPLRPDLPGIQETKTFSVWEALSQPQLLGSKILIVGGGGIGAEVADYLSERGQKVTLIEMREGIALDLVVHLQYFLNLRLQTKGVQILASTKAVHFTPDGIWVEGPEGLKKLSGFDSIVIAMGATPQNELAPILKAKIPEVYVIGDAAKPREVMEAILEATETALKI